MFSFIKNWLSSSDNAEIPSSIYEFTITLIDGKPFSFAELKGKKILIVNTASKCGFTPQFEELEKLHKEYQNSLTIIGFPSNNFLYQDPGTNDEIASFCQKNYGVSFLIAEKSSVIGSNKNPVYKWLTDQRYNGVKSSSVKWNFQKYLINENGKLIDHYPSKTSPYAPEILSAIEN